MNDGDATGGPDNAATRFVAGSGAAARTHEGMVRDHNEDEYLVAAPLFAVADGMGGHRAGEVAAAIATDTLRSAAETGAMRTGEDLARAFAAAHRSILSDGQRSAAHRGMGTTCVAVVLGEGVAHVGHVGDSRAYLLRAGRLERLTEDHSLVAVLVREGVLREEEAERDPRRHVVLRALGADDQALPDLRDVPLASGDRLLLCSDGLSGVVPEPEIASLLADGTPADAAERLVARTLVLGAPDNVTVVVIDPDDVARGTAAAAKARREGGGAGMTGARRPRRRRTAFLAVAAVVAIGAGLATYRVLGGSGGPTATPSPFASPSPTPSVSSPPSPSAAPSPSPFASTSPSAAPSPSAAASPSAATSPSPFASTSPSAAASPSVRP